MSSTKKTTERNRISIGVDQSYTRTGLSICIDGKLTEVGSMSFKGCKCKTDKRNVVKDNIRKVLESLSEIKPEPLVIIVCERIRTYSSNDGEHGLRPDYLKSTGALIASIVDTAYEFDVPVFSADTRAWKTQVVGHSKPEKNDYKVDPKKWPTIKYLKRKHGIDVSFRNKKDRLCFDDDAADSAGLALYAFVPKDRRNLKREE